MVTLLKRYHDNVVVGSDALPTTTTTTTTLPPESDTTFIATEFDPATLSCEAAFTETSQWGRRSVPENWNITCKQERRSDFYYYVLGTNLPEGECVVGPDDIPFDNSFAIVQATHDELPFDAYCYSTGETYPVSINLSLIHI